MTASNTAIDLIKGQEGLELNAYPDPGSKDGLPITIGYGSTMYTDGTKIKLGDTITEDQAGEMLAWEVKNKTSVLNGIGLNLNQNQFDSLTSFIYNVGVGAFMGSTMLKEIRINPNNPDIRNQFRRWIYNDGTQVAGLIKRRELEANLYFS